MIYIANHNHCDISFFDQNDYFVNIDISNDPYNKTLCELAVLKGFCEKTYGKDEDVFGFVHYRRYFEGENCKLITKEEVEKSLMAYDCITALKEDMGISIKDFFIEHHGKELYNITLEAFTEAHPDETDVFQKVYNQNLFIPFNIFIAENHFAKDYWNWLAPVLVLVEEKCKKKNMDLFRQSGFVAERLFNVYLESRKAKIDHHRVRLTGSFEAEYANSQYERNQYDLLTFFKDKKTFLVDTDTDIGINNQYDIVIIRKRLEKEKDPEKFISDVKKLVAENGSLLVFTENRLALKNFLGDTDPYTNTIGDNLENYRAVYSENGRCYSRAEIEKMLHRCGHADFNVYSVLPNISNPKFIIHEDYTPKELMSYRYLPEYNNPETVYAREHFVLDAVVENHLLPTLANGLLFECTKSPKEPLFHEAIISSDRSDIHRIITCIRKDGIVEKIPLNKRAEFHLNNLVANHKNLRDRGIFTVEDEFSNGTYKCKYLNGDTANIYLKNLFYENRDAFIAKMDEFKEIIYRSSNHVYDKQFGTIQPIVDFGYIDLVPINCIVQDDQFIFFDQEFYYEKYPAAVMLYRTIDMVYDTDSKMNDILPKSFFYERYHIKEYLNELHQVELDFVVDLRNEKINEEDIALHRLNYEYIKENRKQMNEKIEGKRS